MSNKQQKIIIDFGCGKNKYNGTIMGGGQRKSNRIGC